MNTPDAKNLTSFDCHNCDNNDPKQSVLYDGLLGYQAVICSCCGAYGDHLDSYPADEWSLEIIKKTPEQVEKFNNEDSKALKHKR